MALSSIVVAIAPEMITSLFTADSDLIGVCVPVIYTLCFLQVFDGLQATFAGIFRGLKHTEITMYANFIAFWVIALPLGCILLILHKLYLSGFWYALIVSAIILCTIMYTNLLKQYKQMGV